LEEKMKTVSWSLPLVLFVAASALAQDRPTENSQSIPPSRQHPFAVTFDLQQVDERMKEIARVTPFTVVNGAVYLKYTGPGPLIPMSGGGASGCFGYVPDLRDAKLKELMKQAPVKLP
jgi:hypothetical protein